MCVCFSYLKCFCAVVLPFPLHAILIHRTNPFRILQISNILNYTYEYGCYHRLLSELRIVIVHLPYRCQPFHCIVRAWHMRVRVRMHACMCVYFKLIVFSLIALTIESVRMPLVKISSDHLRRFEHFYEFFSIRHIVDIPALTRNRSFSCHSRFYSCLYRRFVFICSSFWCCYYLFQVANLIAEPQKIKFISL